MVTDHPNIGDGVIKIDDYITKIRLNLNDTLRRIPPKVRILYE